MHVLRSALLPRIPRHTITRYFTFASMTDNNNTSSKDVASKTSTPAEHTSTLESRAASTLAIEFPVLTSASLTSEQPRLTRGSIDGRQIKVVSFDLDDTVWECAPALHRAMDAQDEHIREHYPQVAIVIDAHGGFANVFSAVTKEEPHLAYDMTALRKRALARMAQTSKLAVDDHTTFIDSTFQVFMDHRNGVLDNIYDGVLALVQRLRQRGLIVVALTNGNAELHNIGNLLSDDLFSIHLNPAMVGAAKPEPHMFKRLLELTGVQAHEVVHVGDSLSSDVAAAKAFGMPAVWVCAHAHTMDTEELDRLADAVVSHTSELEKVLFTEIN